MYKDFLYHSASIKSLHFPVLHIILSNKRWQNTIDILIFKYIPLIFGEEGGDKWDTIRLFREHDKN